MDRPGPGPALARAFLAAATAEGVVPDPNLALCRIADRDPNDPVDLVGSGTGHDADGQAPAVVDPVDLGRLQEYLVADAARTRRGAWYTPAPVAAEIVAGAVTDVGVVGDPTCGGGVFLLAAAERLRTLGAAPSDIVGDLLWGVDLDADAVAVTEAALWWWSARHGQPTMPAGIRAGDALEPGTLPAADVIVGNPPFLGQLKRATAADRARRDRLRAWFPALVRPYTDVAWLVLALALDHVRPGGTVQLLQPQSLLAARDAAPVRDRVASTGELVEVWVGDTDTFPDASVAVCAPRLRRLDTTAPVGVHKSQPIDWTAALRRHHGLPDLGVALDARRVRAQVTGAWTTGTTGTTVGDRATVLGGFRDEYYGLVGAVEEHGDGARLVTSGGIDPFQRLDRPIRFARRRWDQPTIDPTRADEAARRWVSAQDGPSVLIASQTTVIECVADPVGDLVVGVPGVAVVPHDADDLWRVAAAIGSPFASVWMLGRVIGTGLSPGALRPTASLVTALPLPTNAAAWDEGAAITQTLHQAPGDDERWETYVDAMRRAYGCDEAVGAWWLARRAAARPQAGRR